MAAGIDHDQGQGRIQAKDRRLLGPLAISLAKGRGDGGVAAGGEDGGHAGHHHDDGKGDGHGGHLVGIPRLAHKKASARFSSRNAS